MRHRARNRMSLRAFAAAAFPVCIRAILHHSSRVKWSGQKKKIQRGWEKQRDNERERERKTARGRFSITVVSCGDNLETRYLSRGRAVVTSKTYYVTKPRRMRNRNNSGASQCYGRLTVFSRIAFADYRFPSTIDRLMKFLLIFRRRRACNGCVCNDLARNLHCLS